MLSNLIDMMENMWFGHTVFTFLFALFILLAWKKPGPALILLPIIFIPMLILGLMAETVYWVVISIIAFPLGIAVIHWGPSSSQLETPWYKNVTNAVLTLVKYLLILALFCLAFQFFGPIFFVIFLVEVIVFSRAQKYGLVIDIISTIAAAIRQSLPLPTALTAAAHGQNKKEARILNNIAYWLTQGWPLSEALRRSYPKCPSNILASVTAAEKMDQLPRAIESLQADLAEKMPPQNTEENNNLSYPLVVLTVVVSIMLGLSIFIIPTFSEVLSDISDGQAALPATTQSLLNFSSWLTANKGFHALMVLCGILVFAFCVLHIKFRKRTPEKPRLLSRLGDRIKWHLPVLHWFEKTLGNLTLVQTLRVGLVAGCPVNTILRNALGLDVNICYHNRIRTWLDKIEAGENIAKAARACGLDKPLAWAFDDKINKGSTPQILEGLEEVYRCNYNYRKNVLAAASWPLTILGLGLIVGYVVYAMFMGSFSILFVTLQYTIPQ